MKARASNFLCIYTKIEKRQKTKDVCDERND